MRNARNEFQAGGGEAPPPALESNVIDLSFAHGFFPLIGEVGFEICTLLSSSLLKREPLYT
jgi:hypothetical protein